MTGSEIAAVAAVGKPLVGPVLAKAVGIRKHPRRLFLKELHAGVHPGNPKLSRGERRRLLAAYRNGSLKPDLLASTDVPSDPLMERLRDLLDRDRRSQRAMPFEDQVLDYADSLIDNFVIYERYPDRAILQQSRAIKADTEEIRGSMEAVLALVEERQRGSAGSEAARQGDADYRRRLVTRLDDALEAARVPLRGRTDRGEDGSVRGLVTDGLPTWWSWAVVGSGGAGKTTELRALARHLLEEGDQVVYLDLKALAAEARAEAAAGRLTIDALLSGSAGSSLVPTSRQALMAGVEQASQRLYWLLDGMNELPSGTAHAVLRLVKSELRSSDAVIVSDRDSRPYEQDRTTGEPVWAVISVHEIDQDLATSAVDAQFGVGAFEGLSSKRQQLLRLPFFLDLALRSDHLADSASAADAIRQYVRDHVGLTEGEISQTAEFAFHIYARRGSLSATPAEVAADLDDTTTAKLINSGTLRDSGGRLEFRHQLLLDFFAGNWFGRHRALWTTEAFNAISLDANSIDGLLFATEVQSSEALTEQILTYMHDWNWFATVRCLHSAKEQEVRIGPEIALALAAMLAMKVFDPVLGSRGRAERWTEKLDAAFGWHFVGAKDPGDLNALVQQAAPQSPQEGWFETWLGAFTGTYSTLVLVQMLANANPLVGWAAANALRSTDLQAEELAVLRAMYDAQLLDDGVHSSTVRWRVVHALGWRDDPANRSLLLQALDRDPEMWVRYGAVRGLVECAATGAPSIRDSVLDELRARLSALSGEPATQLYWAATRAEALPGWPEEVLPLLREAVALAPESERRDRQRRLTDFEEWANDGVTLPSSTYRG